MSQNPEFRRYKDTISSLMEEILEGAKAIENAADMVAQSILKDQLVHVIGPGGHSSMAAEEVLWRAGGLAPINAILDAGFNLIHGAKRSNIVERTPGYAARVMDSYRVGRTPGEIIIIVNAYGVNAMCIDTASEAKKRGMISIGITSRSFADNLPPDHPARHPSGKVLYQEVDHFLDCRLPLGDAVMEIEGSPEKTGPTSTFCNAFTINLLMMETVKRIVAGGETPPLWRSANLPGGDEANRALEEKYIPRVRHLA
ncbi:MAG: SIS domain-containing protein [Rhodospirillales bacterium]|nr:SIS domain-containing protein [Rhodospirillales bacterium]